MKGLLKFCVFIAFLAGLFYVRDALIRTSIREQSYPFVANIVSNISAGWNRAELDKVADPALIDQVTAMGNPHALDFPRFAQLGPRTGELSCRLVDYTKYKDETRNYLATSYACNAQFQHGPASIFINTMREKEESPWRVGYFDVVSPNFSPTVTSGNR